MRHPSSYSRCWKLIKIMGNNITLTDVIVQLFSQIRIFVQQGQTLVHPLLDHMEMRVHLKNIKIHWTSAFYQGSKIKEYEPRREQRGIGSLIESTMEKNRLFMESCLELLFLRSAKTDFDVGLMKREFISVSPLTDQFLLTYLCYVLTPQSTMLCVFQGQQKKEPCIPKAEM